MTDVYRISGPIYRLVGYGEIGYYRDLAQAERNIRACGDEFETVTLVLKGKRIYDTSWVNAETPRPWINPVGDVIAEEDVPAKDRWQIA